MNVDIKSSRLLGQSRPTNTDAASVYTPAKGILGVVTGIIVCNQTGSNENYRIFYDADGTTYDQTTALCYDISITANTTDFLEFPEPGLPIFGDYAGNLAVRSGTPSALTFTVIGYEVR